jgi:1,4-dihydroxy-2-naphthoyl-CoA hydrolase
MSIWKKKWDIETINQRSKGNMGEFLSIDITEIGDDFLKGRMPVNERTKQPFGILHGGASCVLAESLGSMGSFLCVDPEFYTVGLDINTNHIKSITSGFVIGTARPFHIGSSTQVWGINITDEHDKLISVSRLTVAVLKTKG